MYERRKECSLRRLLRDRSGTTPIAVKKFDKSKLKSLRGTLRVDVGKPSPGLPGRRVTVTQWDFSG